jgi:hypothetical protein
MEGVFKKALSLFLEIKGLFLGKGKKLNVF